MRLPKEKDAGADAGMDAPLLYFEQDPESGKDIDPWTFRDAFEGTQVFGGTGSGKTTGSGRSIALALLKSRYEGRHRCGGLVLTAKPEDLDLWANPSAHEPSNAGYCSISGRQGDLIVVGDDVERYRSIGIDTPEYGHSFNFLEYELGAHGGKGGRWIQNLVSLFLTAIEAGRSREDASGEAYWEDALKQLLTNAITIVVQAKQRLVLDDLVRVILTAPQSQLESRSPEWQRSSFCWECLAAAVDGLEDELSRETDPVARHRLNEQYRDLRHTVDYWLLDFAGLHNRTRSIVVSSFTSKATSLLRSPMRRMFSGTEPTWGPEDTWKGKVVVLDLSVKEYGEAGRFAQVLFKTVWQRATERRDLKQYPNPVFLWADESQYFVTAEDAIFQQTARSRRAATVYLTQNISNYYAAMRGRGNAATDALLGNLQTKIFHAQGDPATNQWAEKLFGQETKAMESWGISGQGLQMGEGDRLAPAVPTERYLRLRKGGGGVVEGIVFIPSYKWVRNGRRRPGALVEFNQNLLRPGGIE